MAGVAAIVVLVSLALYEFLTFEIRHGAGPVVSRPPRVVSSLYAGKALHVNGFTLAKRARLKGEARLLSVQRYRNDPFAELMPIDLALGWGPMSDEAVLDRLEIKHRQRKLELVPRAVQLDAQELRRHSTNVHLIAASETVARQLEQRIRPGTIVTLDGWLVDVVKPRGIHTSVSLEDARPEILWLEKLELAAFADKDG